MKKPTLRLPVFSLRAAGKYGALLSCLILLNFALPAREPFAFPLYYAALCCGFDPLLMGAGYLVSSAAAMSATATLALAIQAAFLSLVFAVYRRARKKMRFERFFFAAAAQLPFVFLFPHEGYSVFPFAVIYQKLILAGFLSLLSLLFEGGLKCLLKNAFRCRLTAGQLTELLLMWFVLGAGLVNALGTTVFSVISLTALLVSVVLLSNAAAVPFAIVLSLPLCLAGGSAIPAAEYAAYACFSLLFVSYGKAASALALVLTFLSAQYFAGLYEQGTTEILLALLSCAAAALIACLLPEKLYKRAKGGLLFYREHTLPRIAINRNRRAVGERLFEVSSLFREIEGAFSTEEPEDDSCARLKEKLKKTLCADCPGRRRCEDADIYESVDKLVAIGFSKGQVSLVDLPADISALCGNAAGMLFACNQLLAGYRSTARELESAREGRRLLARQAHGISEILKDIALEQSEEYSFSDGERALARALATAGILSSEIFVYGDGNTLTVSMTLSPSVNGKRLCAVAGDALGVPLSLAEKIPLSETTACYVLKRRPEYDAAFGIATRPKEGESACGDAYSVLKIDERRFLVALSDGMGSGENARAVSDKTLSLLESFYKAKMPSETVLSTVNRLISYSPEETFACIDMAAVDLDTGEADIVKIGSPVGFILKNEELRVLEGDSLPMGMLEAVHPATLRANMEENDFMLFMSDGVTSAFGSSAELCSYLSVLRPLNPQSLAEEILQNALKRTRGQAEDDMTVLAVKLTKSA